jgi:hypothetical protein
LITNDYVFPTNGILDASSHLLVIYSDKVRSPLHTGFRLPAEGGSLCLIRPDGSEADRVNYPAQAADRAYARFQDGVNGFVVSDSATPGSANVDAGLMPPQVTIDAVDLATLEPDQPIRFFARAQDDLGIVNLTLLWRRLDVQDDVTKRVILYDDGRNGDGGVQDGFFSGLLIPGLPAGAEMQFYLECVDLSGQKDTVPANPRFVSPGQEPMMHTLAVGAPLPRLEISEIVANNTTGLVDEAGSTPDWIEVRNCSAEPVSLSGIRIGQRMFGNSEQMVFTNGSILAPGQHLVIFVDNNPGQGLLHAPFRLNADGDRLVLMGTTANGARGFIDSVTYGPQEKDIAFARLGCGGPWLPSAPTPRAANIVGTWRGVVLTNTFILGFPTELGRTYTVEHRDTIGTGNWIALPVKQGTSFEQTVQAPIDGQRFFRVRQN